MIKMREIIAFFMLCLCINFGTSSVSYRTPYKNSLCTNGVCQETVPIPAQTSQVITCPPSTTYSNGVCVQQNTNPCPVSSQCSRPQLCRSTTQAPCVQPQVCSQNQIMYQGSCVSPPTVQCPIGQQVISGQCYQPPPPPVYVTHPPPVYVPPPPPVYVTQPPPVYIPPPSPIYTPPTERLITSSGEASNFTNIVNITNYVNSTNTHNIVTSTNNSNINNINLGSQSLSGNSQTSNENRSESSKERCCIVRGPRSCEDHEGKRRCRYRAEHKCSEECGEEKQFEVAPSEPKPLPEIVYVPKPYPVNKPVPVPQPVYIDRPIERKVYVSKLVPQPYPIYIPRPQPVPVPVPQPTPVYVGQTHPVPVPVPIPRLVYVQQQQQQIGCQYQPGRWPFAHCNSQVNVCTTCQSNACPTYCEDGGYSQKEMSLGDVSAIGGNMGYGSTPVIGETEFTSMPASGVSFRSIPAFESSSFSDIPASGIRYESIPAGDASFGTFPIGSSQTVLNNYGRLGFLIDKGIPNDDSILSEEIINIPDKEVKSS